MHGLTQFSYRLAPASKLQVHKRSQPRFEANRLVPTKMADGMDNDGPYDPFAETMPPEEGQGQQSSNDAYADR